MKFSQGCKPLPIKVDPGADVNTIPLRQYRSLFPKHFTPYGPLKPHTLRSTQCTCSPHDDETQSFLGFFTTQFQHRTTPDIIPITFYIFEDSTRPYTLLSYPASVHLSTVEFKIPNEASSHAVIDVTINTSEAKQVIFNTLLHTSTPNKKKTTKKQKLKSLLKPDHTLQDQLLITPLQDQLLITPFQDHDMHKITPSAQ